MPVGVADLLVAPGERHRLERHEADLVAVLQGELDDRPDLIVVDRVHDRHDEADVDAGGMEMLDRAQLHVEQVADLAMGVGLFADAVELEIGDAHPGLAGRVRERRILREADAVGRGLDAEVADLPRVAHGVEEDRRDRRLAAGKLHRHLAPRLDRQRVVEQLPDLAHRQLVDIAHLVRVHEARVAHHVAAVGEVDGEHRAAAVLNRGCAVVVQRVRDGGKIASRKEALHPPQELRINREGVREGAVHRAGLLDHDLAVTLEDLRAYFADVFLDERLDGLFARDDPRAGLTNADGAQRICRARPSESRRGALPALEQRGRRPFRLKRSFGELPVHSLKRRPREPRRTRHGEFERFPHVHPNTPPATAHRGAADRAGRRRSLRGVFNRGL